MPDDQITEPPLTPAAAPTVDPRRPMPGIGCPRCGTGRLDPATAADGFVGCPQCGHRAATVHVAEQTWLEQQDAQLHARLDWVRDRVASGEAAAPTGSPFAAPGSPVGGSPAPGSPAAGSPAAGAPGALPPGAVPPHAWPGAVPPRPPIGVQTLLLGFGALCLVLAAVVFVAVAWDRLGALGQVGALLVVVAALAGSAHALRDRYRSTAETLAGSAAAVAAVALVAAPRLGLGADWMLDRPATWAAIALAVVAVLSGVLARVSGLVAWQVGLVTAVVSSGFSTAIAVSGGQEVAPLGCAGLAVAAAAVLLLQPGRGTTFHADAAWVGAGLGTLAVLLGFSGYGDPDRAGGWALAWLVVLASAVALLLPLPGRPEPATVPSGVRPVVAIVAGLAAGQVLPLLALAVRPGMTVPTPVLALAGAAFLCPALLPWHRLRVPAAVAAVTCWLVALPLLAAGDDGVEPQLSLYLTIVALTLLAFSFAPATELAVWPAALLGTVAVWIELGDRQVDTLEAYTGAAAVLLLAAGLLFARVHRDAGSGVVLGPALAVLALPSAVLALGQAADGEQPWRAAAVILGGAALAVLGGWLRVLAPLLVGLAAVLVAGLGQLLALADTLPRWVSLAAAGALLLAAGFSAERLGRTGRHLWQEARRMR